MSKSPQSHFQFCDLLDPDCGATISKFLWARPPCHVQILPIIKSMHRQQTMCTNQSIISYGFDFLRYFYVRAYSSTIISKRIMAPQFHPGHKRRLEAGTDRYDITTSETCKFNDKNGGTLSIRSIPLNPSQCLTILKMIQIISRKSQPVIDPDLKMI